MQGHIHQGRSSRRSYHEAIIQLTFEPSSHQDFIMTTLDRYRGCLLGLAAGDALGTTLEFKWPGNFEPLTDMVGGGPFNLNPGEWTDDTSMALCLAESLVVEARVRPGSPTRNLPPVVARRAPEREGPLLRHRHRNPRGPAAISSHARSVLRGSEPPRGRERSLMRLAPAPWRSRTTQPRRSDSRAKVPAPPTPRPNASMLAATSRGCSWRPSAASRRTRF